MRGCVRLRQRCDRFFEFKGPKWPIMKQVLQSMSVRDYEFVWFPDDDLQISTTHINLMFLVAEYYKCVVAEYCHAPGLIMCAAAAAAAVLFPRVPQAGPWATRTIQHERGTCAFSAGRGL